jgi:hypothetical protein
MTRQDQIIEDRNYYSDARVRAAEDGEDFKVLSTKGPTMLIELDELIVEIMCEDGLCPEDFDGKLEVPFKFEVCPLCQGHGKHVNPSIDCGGISAEDFHEDPDFAEEYMNGRYDITCAKCKGQRVVPTVTLPEEVEKTIREIHKNRADDRRTEMAERMMGA